MKDNHDSYLVNVMLDTYEEPLDISLISNNPSIPLIGINFNPLMHNFPKWSDTL